MPKPPLNSEQTNIVREKVVSLNRPIDDLLGILGPVAQYDAAGDKSRTVFGCSGAVALLAGIILLFVDVIPLHFIVGAGLIAVAVVLFIVMSKKTSEDLSDNLRRCAVPFLAALREDFGSEPIALKLDLRPPLAKEKQQSKEKVDKVTITTWSDPWMSGDGVLHDGSRLRWSVVETIIEKSYWKRGSSGKSKLKTKKKKRVEIEVDLTLKAKTYGEKQTLHNEVKHKRDTITPIPPDLIISAIAQLYTDAQPAAS